MKPIQNKPKGHSTAMRVVLVLVYVFLIILLILSLLINCRGCSLPDTPDPEPPAPPTPTPTPTDTVPSNPYEQADQIGGDGDLKVTLMWNFYADIDLHVFEPNGNEIYYMDKNSSTGGTLDVDNIPGGPGSAENIFWNNPPRGQYKVTLVYYNANDDYSESQQQGQCIVVVKKRGERGEEARSFRVNLGPQHARQYVNITTVDI